MQHIMPSATTRLLTLLGDPVEHSLSPVFQTAAIRHCGIDAVYTALRCDAQSLAPLLRGIARGGGAGNVTVPHKALAAECIERPTAALQRTGACNTFWLEDGVICGDNTDVAGFRNAAGALLGQGRGELAGDRSGDLPDDPPVHGSGSLRGVRALIVGAGGAAAAATFALLEDGADSVTLINRSPDRARTLAARLDPAEGTVSVVTSVRMLHDRAFDLVVNASSVGLHHDDPLPIDLTLLRDVGAALDIVYRRGGATPWVTHARKHEVRAADGTGMLIGQGAAAFERWFGVPAPVEVMRGALSSGQTGAGAGT
jgi:shikimate dehydrogenase